MNGIISVRYSGVIHVKIFLLLSVIHKKLRGKIDTIPWMILILYCICQTKSSLLKRLFYKACGICLMRLSVTE